MSSKVLIAGDHSSLTLKTALSQHLIQRGFEVEDLGTNSSESVSYVDFAVQACSTYLESDYAFGVLICGTGIGISIAANKIRSIRCALPQNSFAAQMAKEHNNANFIAFGARISYDEEPKQILDAYIDASFAGKRHQDRLQQISDLESDDFL